MRRLVYVLACLAAVVCGFLIPVLAFGQGGQAGGSEPGKATTTDAGASVISADEARAMRFAATLIALVARPDPVTTTVTTTDPAVTVTTTDQPSTSVSTASDTSLATETTASATTGDTGTEGTTTASTTTPSTGTEATTGSTTTVGTDTGGTTTGGTTTGGDSGANGGGSHIRLKEWLAAILALVLLAGVLWGVDAALIAEKKDTTRHALAGSASPDSFLAHPVPRFLLLGEDGRWATSKTLASVWTASLVWAISALALSDLFGAPEGWNAFKDQAVSWQYLLLLGGPVAASIGAQALTLVRSQTGAEVKTAPPEGASFSQLYTDDCGKLDLIDVQYLTFNVLSILVFLVVFVADLSAGLPTFPGVLATITAATAAAYLARRAALRADPVITSIAPPAAAPGELVRLWGVNLTPAREAKSVELLDEEERERVAEEESSLAAIDVFFDGLRALDVKPVGSQTSDLSEAYEVRVPAGAAIKDSVQVVVNSRGTRGHKSTPYTDFKVVGPVLASVRPPVSKPGATVTLWGTKLGSDSERPQVFLDDLPGEVTSFREGSDSSQDLIEVKVPEVAAGAVKVKLITTGGQTSNELDLRISADVRITDAPRRLALGPNTDSLLIRGLGFITQPGTPVLAAVFLDGQPLAVEEGKWSPTSVTAKLPTNADELKKLGFQAKDDAQLVVRNDEGHSSDPWPLKLELPA